MMDIRNLSTLSFAHGERFGFTHWHYRTQDDGFVRVTAQGYFKDARDMMKPGDLLTVVVLAYKNGAGPFAETRQFYVSHLTLDGPAIKPLGATLAPGGTKLSLR